MMSSGLSRELIKNNVLPMSAKQVPLAQDPVDGLGQVVLWVHEKLSLFFLKTNLNKLN